MKLIKSFKHALNMVVHAKIRSWLTILGIVIGVAAVISIVSLGNALEANVTSQFEQHLRSILNLPLGNTECTTAAVMINVLGEKNNTGPAIYKGIKETMALPGVFRR